MTDFRYHGRGPYHFHISPGECVCLSGESGAGKTLLLRALADLDPAQGDVSLHQIPRTTIPAPQWRRRVGFLAAESQWWRDAVGEHFSSEPAEAALQALGFSREALNWQVARLSTGERQRLGLLRLLVGAPEVLLLDEPSANLDARNREQIETLLRDYQHQHQAMLLWVSHDQEQIRRVGQRHLHLEADGTLRAEEINGC